MGGKTGQRFFDKHHGLASATPTCIFLRLCVSHIEREKKEME